MIPGSNLFNSAARLIRLEDVGYLRNTGRTQNAARQWIPQFASQTDIKASVQAIPRSKYQDFGLDFQKRYVKVFSNSPLIDLSRGVSGDRLIHGGRLYEVNSNNDWFVVDGWISCIAADIGVAP